MQKTLTLLTVLLCATVIHAQGIQYQKDPNLKTFVQDSHALPNQNLQAALRDGAAWENFRQAHGNWWVEFNEQTSTPHRAFGTPIAGSGASAEEKAYNFFMNELRAFGSNQVDIDIRSNNTSKYHYITYVQEFNGIEVLWSEATFRVSLDGNIVMFGLDIYPDINLSTTPGLSAEAAQTFASNGIIGTVTSADGNELKILPVSGEGKLEYKLVYEINVHVIQADGIPGNYYTLVDANSGAVYYRQNEVYACGAPANAMGANIQINADIQDNPLVGLVNRGLPYIRIEIDGDYYFADANGLLSLNTITDPTPALNDLQGRYAKVSQGNPDVFMGVETFHVDTAAVTIIPGDNTIEFDVESGALASEVSAYYWQNIVHDYMKSYWPTFNDLDFPQLVRVERTDGSCNAFYDGVSTNFYAAGGGCPSTALFNDVVMHEYGHGINFDLYNWLGDPGGMSNGALNEAYADIWAISVTDNPILGQGFTGGAGTYVRRYDIAPKIYPQDLIGEVHADGEIIAGAWWDVEENFGSHTDMTDLFNEAYFAIPDGAAGNEGTIYTDILIDALIADDDNADLTDGTPRFDEITSAFCEHGIALIGQVSSDHEGIFTYVSPDAPIEIVTEIDVDYPTYIGDLNMYYKINNEPTWTTSLMTNIGGTTYQANLPAQPEGTVIGYYIQMSDVNGCGNAVFPAEANTDDPNLPFYALVGYYLQHTEDFDNDFGSWIVDPFGDDDAETGEWDINEPIGSTDDVGYQVQTSNDHTAGSGNLCAFTGNAALFDGVGTNDVDHGKTTLRSDVLDLTVYEDPVAVYWRKYSNDSPTSANPGNDVWQVYISDDEENWVKVERTYTSDNTWRRNAIRVKDYVDVTETVSFIFIAQDSVLDPSEPDPLIAGGSLVEAAIDDLEIWDTKEADTSGNNIINSELIAGVFPNPASEFVNVYFSADVTGDVEITLYNTVGEIISTNHITASTGSAYTLRTSNLPEGIYMISCKTEKGSANKRVMIQHQ